jgi:hypothetical protein
MKESAQRHNIDIRISDDVRKNVFLLEWKRESTGIVKPKVVDIHKLFANLAEKNLEISGFNPENVLPTSTVDVDSISDPGQLEIRFKIKLAKPVDKEYKIFSHLTTADDAKLTEHFETQVYADIESIFQINISYITGRFYVEHIPENLKGIKDNRKLISKLIEATLKSIS